MGCYKMVCAATNTTINEGDEVVLFYFINSLVESNPVYSETKKMEFKRTNKKKHLWFSKRN